MNNRSKDQYLQSWDKKARVTYKIFILHKLKQNQYKFSDYLNETDNIQDRIMVTKLKIGCTKLKNHRFLKQVSMDTKLRTHRGLKYFFMVNYYTLFRNMDHY